MEQPSSTRLGVDLSRKGNGSSIKTQEGYHDIDLPRENGVSGDVSNVEKMIPSHAS
jgi:hypothetical protein